MRDPKRIDPFLATLAEVWQRYPDLRFGQLISIICVQDALDLFDIEDTDLYSKLLTFKMKWSNTNG